MNVTRASRTGRKQNELFVLMASFFMFFLIITFAGALFKLYSVDMWIVFVIVYIIIMFGYGLKEQGEF